MRVFKNVHNCGGSNSEIRYDDLWGYRGLGKGRGMGCSLNIEKINTIGIGCVERTRIVKFGSRFGTMRPKWYDMPSRCGRILKFNMRVINDVNWSDNKEFLEKCNRGVRLVRRC